MLFNYVQNIFLYWNGLPYSMIYLLVLTKLLAVWSDGPIMLSILAIDSNETLPNNKIFDKRRFKIVPKPNKPSKDCPKPFKIPPKWRKFAKFGYTDH